MNGPEYIERCSRGHAIAGYRDVDTYCNRCQEDLPVLERERDEAREQLRAAVEGLRKIEAGEPLHRYAWCRAIARSTLATVGPTYIKGP